MNKKILSQNLESLGRKYEREHLSIWKSSNLESDCWQALKFFFSHSFMRGRRDELSLEYYEFTIKVLTYYFDSIISDFPDKLKSAKDKNLFRTDCIKELKNGKSNSIKHLDFENKIRQENTLIKSLTTKTKVEIEFHKGNRYTKNICLQNDMDLLMVLDTLNFISFLPNNINIYKHFNDLITGNKIDVAYLELNKLSGIGDKISTFFLRDIALINNYNLSKEQIKYVFPVDTWVAQITTLIADKQFSALRPNEIKKYFIQNFPENNFSLIAAGIWYLGFNSLDIAIEYVKTNNLQ
jgi:hypothetical protein